MTMNSVLLCSDCFADHGLFLDAYHIGRENDSTCSNCGSAKGRKLLRDDIERLAHRFFVRGTLHRTDFGAAPALQFNHRQNTSADFDTKVAADAKLIAQAIGIGFFYYEPHLWMIGEIEPLKELVQPSTRNGVINRILAEYPVRPLIPGSLFYRLRINPSRPQDLLQYDSPPDHLAGKGRLDRAGSPVMYASQDIEVCIHECRATVDDILYVATLTPSKELRILDLADLLEESGTEYESLDMAVHMLFLAGEHSYDISRDLASHARDQGIDGIAYPSYFSLVRTGVMPFENAYGISIRKLPPFSERVKAQTIRNLALFGRPIADHTVNEVCINRTFIRRAAYDIGFGPVTY